MTENKEYKNVPQYQEEDELEIDLMEYARKLWAARKLLLKVAGIAAVVGVVIALSIPKKYTAEVTLSPESGKGGGSSLSGMAAMLGIGSVNMGGDANALNISMTSDIVATTPFILELFDTQVKTLDGEVDTTFVAYLETESAPWWSAVMSLPGKAIGGVMSLFSSKEEEEEIKAIEEELKKLQEQKTVPGVLTLWANLHLVRAENQSKANFLLLRVIRLVALQKWAETEKHKQYFHFVVNHLMQRKRELTKC